MKFLHHETDFHEQSEAASGQYKMDGPIFLLVFLIACGAMGSVSWFLQRDCPTDRSVIDNFAEQRGLRIVAVIRSYSFLRHYWFHGIGAANPVRFYEVTVEESEGDRGDIHVGFDSLFGAGQLVMWEQQGSALTPPDGPVSVTQSDSEPARLSWIWCERLAFLVVGAGISGFFFGNSLYTYLQPPKRPLFPEPALGYTHSFISKHGKVYGTFFEYLAVSYGSWMMWSGIILSGLFFFHPKITHSRTYPRYPWQIFSAAAISMALYYAIWWVSICVTRS